MTGAHQRGVALIVALIFLLILTVLGTTAAMNNSLQERMAGHTRDRDLAFQAAEHALNDAEDFLNSQTTAAMDALLDTGPPCADLVVNDGIRCFDTTNPPPNDASYWRNTFNWASTDLASPALTVDEIASQPLYVIEQVPSYTDPSTLVTYRYYRVTARGTGGSDEAVVVLQAMHRMEE